MKNKTDFFIGLTLFIFCGVMGHQIYILPEPAAQDLFTAGSFPAGVTIALGLLSIILIARAMFDKEGINVHYWPERIIFIKIFMMGVWILAYVIGFIFVGEYAYDMEWPDGSGFVLSTLVFLTGAQFLTGYRNPFNILLISCAISAFLYVVFAIFFKVPLP